MKRKTTNTLRIIAAIGSVALMSAYVWYRAQAAASPSGAAPNVEPAANRQDVVLPGSKSAEVFPAPAVHAQTPAAEKPRAVMGGSKSAAIATPDRPPFAAPAQSADSTTAPLAHPNGAPFIAPQKATGPGRN